MSVDRGCMVLAGGLVRWWGVGLLDGFDATGTRTRTGTGIGMGTGMG